MMGAEEEGVSAGIEGKWREAKGAIGEKIARAARRSRRDGYTVEEREGGIEGVETGLKKPMRLGGDGDSDDSEEEEEDEDEDEDEEMDDVEVRENGNPTIGTGSGSGNGQREKEKTIEGPVRSLDEIARFMTTGIEPREEIRGIGVAYRR
jgi:hypothetical protein